MLPKPERLLAHGGTAYSPPHSRSSQSEIVYAVLYGPGTVTAAADQGR